MPYAKAGMLHPFLAMLYLFLGMLCPYLGMLRPLQPMSRPFPAMRYPFPALHRPFFAMLHAFPAMLHAFAAMRCEGEDAIHEESRGHHALHAVPDPFRRRGTSLRVDVLFFIVHLLVKRDDDALRADPCRRGRAPGSRSVHGRLWRLGDPFSC